MFQLELMEHRLRGYAPQRKWYRHFSQRSAVSLILRQRDAAVDVLMIERATRPGDPWSGQMGFPGGRRDALDRDSLATALRETREELGLPLEQSARMLGRLSDLRAQPQRQRRPMVISPFVFAVEQIGDLKPDPAEVSDILWVPLACFADPQQRQMMTLQRRGMPVRLPCHDYQGKRIWGLSLMMLDELLRCIAASRLD